MLEYELDKGEQTMHLRLIGRNSIDDFQNVMPDIICSAKLKEFKNLIIEILNLKEADDYVDPDLAFYSINELKRWAAKVGVVCKNEIPDDVDLLMDVFRNHEIPVRYFKNISDARDWF